MTVHNIVLVIHKPRPTHTLFLDIVPAFPSIAPESVFPDRFSMTGVFFFEGYLKCATKTTLKESDLGCSSSSSLVNSERKII